MGAFQNHLHALYGLPGGFSSNIQPAIGGGGKTYSRTLRFIYPPLVVRQALSVIEELKASENIEAYQDSISEYKNLRDNLLALDRSISNYKIDIESLKARGAERIQILSIAKKLREALISAKKEVAKQEVISKQIIDLYDDELILMMLLH